MNIKSGFLFLLVFSVAIFILNPEAMAARGCNLTQPMEPADFIETDEVPPGCTKIDGTVAVYYKDTDVSNIKDVHFFLRLIGNFTYGGGNPIPSDPWGVVGVSGGKEIMSFDYLAEDILYSGEAGIAQNQEAFKYFLENVVNPHIYKVKSPSGEEVCYPHNPNQQLMPECPPIFLHSVSNVIEDSGIGSGLWFVIGDLIIAIDE
jgi:hypothetical protein